MVVAPVIMIVEDEADAANLLQHRLQKRGYRTIAIDNGIDAMNTAFESKPDLIILDLMLPKLHGFEVCRMLKYSPITRSIPILMLTAMHDPENKVAGLRVGADDYVTKPYDLPELLARIDALLRRAVVSTVAPFDRR
jgi:DNA-binding response OmpR family regulator